MRVQNLADQVGEATAWATGTNPRIELGFPFFDRRTEGGVTFGELTMFLARTSVGKTWWLLNVINHNPTVPTVFFSLEMAARAIVVRLAGVANDVPTSTIYRQLRTEGHSAALAALPDQFPHLAIVDEPGLNLRQMTEVLHEFEDVTGQRPRLVGIDFLELLRGVPGMDKVGQVTDTTRALKEWTRTHDVSTVVLHQVPRGDKNNGHQPLSLFSGRYGGEELADYVLAGYRPHLAPELSQEQREATRPDFYVQFLKTRSGHETHEEGVLHRINPESGRIRPLRPGQYWHQDYLNDELRDDEPF
jgi:replicative DNA helicase